MSEVRDPPPYVPWVLSGERQFHFSKTCEGFQRFRLVAVLADGRTALIRMGETIRESAAEPLPIAASLAGEVVELRIEQWHGPFSRGEWKPIDSSRRAPRDFRYRRRRRRRGVK